MINKDSRSTKQQLENIDTVTTNRKEQQQLAQLHILGTAGSMRQSPIATLLSTNQTFSHKFNTAGEFPYFCQLHPTMLGKVVVVS